LDGWERRRQAGGAASGGAQCELAGELAGDDQNDAPVRQNSPDKDQKKEEGAVNSLRGLDRRKTRRRRRSTARAELRFGFLGGGGVEDRRSSGEWCGLERCSGVPFIGGEGRGGGATEVVGGGAPVGHH
jgi:hypothetical protein